MKRQNAEWEKIFENPAFNEDLRPGYTANSQSSAMINKQPEGKWLIGVPGASAKQWGGWKRNMKPQLKPPSDRGNQCGASPKIRSGSSGRVLWVSWGLSTETQSTNLKGHTHPNVRCSIIYNSRDLEAARLPISRRAHIYNGVPLGCKKEWNLTICNSTDGPRGW